MNEDDRMNRLPEGGADALDPHPQDFDAELSGLLGSSLKPVAPPPRVRDRLLSAIRDTPQEDSSASVVAPAPALRAEGGDDGKAGTGTGASITELHSRRRRLLFDWTMRAAAAVVLVGVGLGGYFYGRSSTMDDMSEAHSYAMLNQMQDVRRASDTMPDGHIATLTWSSSMDMAAVTLPSAMNEGMGADSGKILQVWVRKNGVVSSAGMYEPSKGMDFSFISIMPEEGIDVFVTQEPAGGSEQPTGAPLVVLRVGEGEGTPSDDAGTDDSASGASKNSSTEEKTGQA